MSLEQVAIEDLAEGMYVSRLDRPWLETPFLFQGFVIKSREEIEELKRYCSHVYVQAGHRAEPASARGSHRPRRPRASAAPRKGLGARLATWLRKPAEVAACPAPGDYYPDTETVREEFPRAREAYSRAAESLAETMERMRAGGTLDVRTLEWVVNPMLESLLRNKDAITWLSRMKQADDYTYGHSVSCGIYAIAFGRHLGLPKEDLEVLGLGGLLLDIGKTRIPKELLAKRDPLTGEELELMRAHVLHGERIITEQADVDARVLSMVRSHHERYNGCGYPDGLKGPDIHVFARIAGIVDFYDALITPRAYAPAISAFDAMRELNKRSNTEFQAEMVEQFIQAVGVFPNGALVELSNGQVGVVIEQNRVRRLRPKVMIILDRDKTPKTEPQAFDLREHPAEPGEKDAVWIDRGLEPGAYGIDPADFFL